MNFMEAVKAMKEGKKVRRPTFTSGYYFIENEIITSSEYGNAYITHFNVEATDWEVVEERK